MIYPEFDKYTIENLQQQLVVLYHCIAQEKENKKKILSIDFQPAIDYGEEVRINHLRTCQNRLNFDETRRNKIQFEIQYRCEELGIDPPAYNL